MIQDGTKEKMQISSGDRGTFKYTKNLRITNYGKQAFFTVGLMKTKLQITPSAGEDVGKQAITDCGWSLRQYSRLGVARRATSGNWGQSFKWSKL